MKKDNATHLLSGTPITVQHGQSFKMGCCGCKLTHHIQVEIKGSKVILTVFIDEYMTKRLRSK